MLKIKKKKNTFTLKIEPMRFCGNEMDLVSPDDVRFTCVSPAHLVRGVVVGEGIRKADTIGHNHTAVLAVH